MISVIHMRVVMDTDVVVAAMRSLQGASASIVREARAGRITLLMSVPLVIEYEAVCLRPDHYQAAGLGPDEAGEFIDALVAMAEPVKTHYLWRPQLTDPKDEMVLDTVVNGRADALVTFNLRHFGPVSRLFGIRLMAPRDLVLELRKARIDQ